MRVFVFFAAFCLGFALASDLSKRTTTSTEATTTSTEKPDTTTTSTPKPTTTTPIITTTASPDGVPKFVVDNGNVSCIVFKANLTLFVPYWTAGKLQTKSFPILAGASTTGSCGNTTQSMTLSWSPEKSNASFSLMMQFDKLPAEASTADSTVVRLIKFNYDRSQDIFPQINDTTPAEVSINGTFFKTPSTAGYTCAPQVNITMNGSANVILSVSALQFEAFRETNSTDFSRKTVDCQTTPGTNNAIPIAVGVTFAILIVLAVVAFLVGNRRRAQGYQTI